MPTTGVAKSLHSTRWYEADLLVTAESLDRRYYREPVLVAEVLSPTTEDFDRRVKLTDYRNLPSVQEVLLIAQDRMQVELHRRVSGDDWTLTTFTDPDATLTLAAGPLELRLGALYEGVGM